MEEKHRNVREQRKQEAKAIGGTEWGLLLTTGLPTADCEAGA